MSLTFKFLVTVFVTVAGASFQFYSFAVLNTTQITLEGWINETYRERNGIGLASRELTLFWSFMVGILPFGALVGSLVTSVVAERCGRRNGLILSGWITVFGGLFQLLARFTISPELLMLGRCLMGVCIGLNCGLAPMYLTEISPVHVRGAVGATHQVASAFGDWFCMLVSLPMILGGKIAWPIALAFPTIPALLLCLILPFCPESPRFLLLKLGDRVGATKSAYDLIGHDTQEAVSMMEELEQEAAVVRVVNKDCRLWILLPELTKPAIIVVIMMVSQQFTGISAVFSYSSQIFLGAHLDLQIAQLSTTAIGFCYFISTIPAMWLIETRGRRFLTILQLTGCLVCLVLLSLSIALNNYLNLQWASYGSIVILSLYMCVYGVGSPVSWIIATELFSQDFRSSAVSIGTFTSFTMAFVVSTMYLPLIEAWGPVVCFVPFIVVLIVCLIGIVLFLPETKDRRIDEIVEEFRHSDAFFLGLHTYTPMEHFSNTSSTASLHKKTDGDSDTKKESLLKDTIVTLENYGTVG